MASPCKKFKFASKKDSSLRCTQESMITSTPQRCSGKTVSPSVSSIASIATTSGSRTRLFNVSQIYLEKENIDPQENNRSIQSARSLISEVSQLTPFETEEDYDKFFNNLGKIKFTGTVWNLYKPQHENTIYEKIFTEPYNAESHVDEFLFSLSKKPKRSLCRIIQFCVDVCGFQNFDVSKNYKFIDEKAGIAIIDLLKSETISDKSKLLNKTAGRYLLMEHSALAKIFKIGIYNFMQKLILMGYERDIFSDEMFSKHFFDFIKCMTYSNMRSVRDTGVIFAIKILTALVLVYKKIVDDSNYLSDISNLDDNSKILRNNKKEFSAAIEYFYMIFLRNCQFHDGKSYMMRVECVHELIIWIKYIPKLFLDDFLAIKYITRLLMDPYKDVRYATLEICLKIIHSIEIFNYLKTMKTEFAGAVAARFYDVDYRVAVQAIDIFTALLKLDDTFVSDQHYKVLLSLILDKYYPIGAAACRFYKHYLHSMSEIPGDMLKNLARLTVIKPGTYVTELVVEGCLSSFNEIRNWKLYATLLLEKPGEDLESKQGLAKLFSEAVQQTLTGKPTVMRQLSKYVEVDPNEHKKLANTLSLLNKVLQEFQDVPDILQEVLKIIPAVNSNVLDGTFCQTCMDICITVEALFNHYNEGGLLEKLAEALRYFCGVANFGERAKRIVERLAEKQATELLEVLAQPTPASPSDECLRVATLYARFNLNEHFTWDVLYDNWGEVHPDTTRNLLNCCKWYIIWNLRNLTDPSRKYEARQLDNHISIHMRICNEFTNTCFNMLNNLNGELLHYEVYNCICDFYLAHDENLECPIKLNKQFERLQLTIDFAEVEQLLVNFLKTYVITSKELSLKTKRVQVVRYVNLIHNGILSVDLLKHLFQYYNIYYNEYGPIIEASIIDISKFDDENIILMLIVSTMIIVYENIVSRYTLVALDSEEAKNLKLLVKQFINFKLFRAPSKRFKKLVYFLLVYVFKDPPKYEFLYFLKYFIDRLYDDDRKELMSYFKETIPEGADKNDAILYFAKLMKTKTIATNKKRKQGSKKDKVKEPKPSTKARKPVAPDSSMKTPLKTKSQVIEVDDSEPSEDDLTIHDNTSDDLEELNSLQINDPVIH